MTRLVRVIHVFLFSVAKTRMARMKRLLLAQA